MVLEKPYKTIKETHNSSGLSMYYLRTGLANGTIPHIKIGKKYYINYPLFMQKLEAESVK